MLKIDDISSGMSVLCSLNTVSENGPRRMHNNQLLSNYNLAECNNCALFFFPKEEMFALLSFIDVGGQFCCV